MKKRLKKDLKKLAANMKEVAQAMRKIHGEWPGHGVELRNAAKTVDGWVDGLEGDKG